MRKQNKAKSALPNCVAGGTEETAIADMWLDHYEELLPVKIHLSYRYRIGIARHYRLGIAFLSFFVTRGRYRFGVAM